ncbi:uncharacterized protein [Penaeus vannamei]|uniref:uncharacterized protein n=1 Tax=Penaeus vannamei TaxID=6689 RepID=UPI00387FA8B0
MELRQSAECCADGRDYITESESCELRSGSDLSSCVRFAFYVARGVEWIVPNRKCFLQFISSHLILLADIRTVKELHVVLMSTVDYNKSYLILLAYFSFAVYTLGRFATSGDGSVMNSMLKSVGVSAQVPEYQIDAACGLAGSGPAYIYAAIEALADGGVKMGLPRHLAQTLAAQTVKGAATMVMETGKHPGQLKDEVCSPGGTTITAMHVLERNGLRNALISAVEASANRSKELGKK